MGCGARCGGSRGVLVVPGRRCHIEVCHLPLGILGLLLSIEGVIKSQAQTRNCTTQAASPPRSHSLVLERFYQIYSKVAETSLSVKCSVGLSHLAAPLLAACDTG